MTTFQRRKAAGLCTRCGTVPPFPGMRDCEPCLERHLLTYDKTYDSLAARATRMARRRGVLPDDGATYGPPLIAHCGEWHQISSVPCILTCCGVVFFEKAPIAPPSAHASPLYVHEERMP